MTTAVGGSYFELVRKLPLRPIRTRAEYRRASAMLDQLAVHDERELDAGQRDYLLVLADLIETYDEKHYRLGLARKSPLQVLKYLMKQSAMRPADLARVIGSQTAASLILGGKRQLSKRHIIRLAEHFRVEPGLFLSP
jgi:HTH-type transcriptional regulator/antitoxin HigA